MNIYVQLVSLKKTRKVYCKSFLAAIAREEWSWHRGGVSHHFSRNFCTILGSYHTEVYIGQCRLPLTKHHKICHLNNKKLMSYLSRGWEAQDQGAILGDIVVRTLFQFRSQCLAVEKRLGISLEALL